MSLAGAGGGAFRADIQGLRGVAVLSVVAYHAQERLAPGGFIGVDIFFVISGFLITGILLRELESGAMSIAGFYQRRVRRLFPALFAMLAGVLGYGALTLAPDEFAELARTAASTIFFVSNFDFYTLSGYFDGAAADKPLLHTWSLAVEEQFYILFPLFLALIAKRAPKAMGAVLALACLGAFAVSAWGAAKHATAAFYLTPFRAFELLFGALAARYGARFQLNPPMRESLALASAALIAYGLFFYRSGIAFPGLAALVPCLGAAGLIVAGIGGTSVAARALGSPVLVFFGAISYSLYLWHWPLLSFARHAFEGPPPLWAVALLVLAAIAIAALSWKFIEQPWLRGAAPRRVVFFWAASAMIGTSLIAAVIWLNHGLPTRFPERAQRFFAAADDYNHLRPRCHSDEGRLIAYESNCTFGAAGVAPSVAVWGDSEGAELVAALGERLSARGMSVMQITSSGCPPGLDYALPEKPSCATHNRGTLDHLLRDERIRTVIFTANFGRYPPSDSPRFHAGYAQAAAALTRAGKTIVLAQPFPNLWIEAPRVLGLHAARGAPLGAIGRPRAVFEADNREAIAFVDAAAAETGALVFRPANTLCDAEFCPAYRPDVGVLYFDGNHITVTGARFVLDAFPWAAIAGPAAPAPAMEAP